MMMKPLLPPQTLKISAAVLCRLMGTRNYSSHVPPWLMFASNEDDKIDLRYFYSLTDQKIVHELRIPELAGRRCIGSSRGYLFSADDNADLTAINPFGGDRLSLPPTSSLHDVPSAVVSAGRITEYKINKTFDGSVVLTEDVSFVRNRHYERAVLSPGLDAVAVTHGCCSWLSFGHVGGRSWSTGLEAPTFRTFDEVIFHKGRLHAVNFHGTLAVFDIDDGSSNPRLVSVGEPANDKFYGTPKRYLVHSPEGDLLLVFKFTKGYWEEGDMDMDFTVYVLDETTYTWNEMETLGDVALFLGINESMSLSTRDLPSIKRNCIYFTDDLTDGQLEQGCYKKPDEMFVNQDGFYRFNLQEMFGDQGIFDFEQKTTIPLYTNDELQQLDWPRPMWVMPTN